jgi:Uma2 family endonuclease
MNPVQTVHQVEYPESDGRPMGETDLHRNWMIRLHDMLSHRYRGQRVYVGSDLLVYFVEGDPSRFVVPDVFVVMDCEPGDRNTFRIWDEGRCPTVVIEVTSRSTRRRDTHYKPSVYAEIGVREYFLYDPTSDYLMPPLKGYRLAGEAYAEIKPDESGNLECRELGLHLRRESGRLVIYDRRTGQPLPTEAETERAAREAERAAREAAETRAREEAEARRALEDEVRRLREQLKRRDS